MAEWSSDEEMLLTRLYIKERKFVPEICEIMGRTRGSVANKIGRLGLIVKNPSDFGW